MARKEQQVFVNGTGSAKYVTVPDETTYETRHAPTSGEIATIKDNLPSGYTWTVVQPVSTNQPTSISYNKIAYLGNSILQHGGTGTNAAPGQDFVVNSDNPSRGMAATRPEKDFFRLLSAKHVAANPSAQNRRMSDFGAPEQTLSAVVGPFLEDLITQPNNNFYNEINDRFAAVHAWAPDLFYYRIGENVDDGEVATMGQTEYRNRTKALIDKIIAGNTNAKVVLSTSVWDKPNHDQAIRAVAAERNYPLADFAGMWQGRNTNGYYAITGGTRSDGGVYNSQGINEHPDDDGMAFIADKLWAATPGSVVIPPTAPPPYVPPVVPPTGGGSSDSFAYQLYADTSQDDPFPVFETNEIKIQLALRTQRPGRDNLPGLGGTVFNIYNKAEPGYNLLFNPRYRLDGTGGSNPGDPYQIGCGQGLSMCLYQGPRPWFSTGETGKTSYYSPDLSGGDVMLGFNPNQGGDDYRNTAKLLNYGRKSSTEWSVRQNPPIFGQFSTYTDVVRFENWGKVEGRIMWLWYRALFNRTQNSFPGPQVLQQGGQEMPCFYINGHKSTIVWYDGANPYTGDGVRQYNYGAERLRGMKQENYMVTEAWIAAIDPATGLGVGLLMNQGRSQTGYFCGPESSPGPFDYINPGADFTYIGNNPLDMLDDQCDYRTKIGVVVGTVAQIREAAYNYGIRMPSKPEFRWNSQSRLRWGYNAGEQPLDTGVLTRHTWDDKEVAITNGWKLYAPSFNSKIYSPASAFKASEFTKLYINMECHGMTQMRFNWRRNRQTRERNVNNGGTAEERYVWTDGLADRAEQYIYFDVYGDGRTSTYTLDMAGRGEWKNIITEMFFNLNMRNPQPDHWVKINWISTNPNGPS